MLTAHDLAEVLSVPPSQAEALPLLVSRLRVDPVGQQQRPSDGGGQGPTSRALWAGRPGCRDGEPAGRGHTGLCSTLCLQECQALPARRVGSSPSRWDVWPNCTTKAAPSIKPQLGGRRGEPGLGFQAPDVDGTVCISREPGASAGPDWGPPSGSL